MKLSGFSDLLIREQIDQLYSPVTLDMLGAIEKYLLTHQMTTNKPIIFPNNDWRMKFRTIATAYVLFVFLIS